MRFLFLSIISVVLLATCNQEMSKEEMVRNMTPPEPPEHYNLVAIAENENFKEEYDTKNINQALSDESRDYLYYGLVWAWDTKVENVTRDYTVNFDIESYPTYLIFDTEELIFKTTDIDEVDEFLSTNKPTWRE